MKDEQIWNHQSLFYHLKKLKAASFGTVNISVNLLPIEEILICCCLLFFFFFFFFFFSMKFMNELLITSYIEFTKIHDCYEFPLCSVNVSLTWTMANGKSTHDSGSLIMRDKATQ